MTASNGASLPCDVASGALPRAPLMRRHVILCVFLVSSSAILVLLCRAALVLAHLARSHGASINVAPVVRETAVLAVHVRAPLKRDPVESVAAAQLARVRGASFKTDASAAADANTERRGGDRGTVVNFDDLLVVCENDRNTPLSRAEIQSWLGYPSLKIVDASRDVERKRLSPGFDVFSGIYGAAVKARAIRALAESETVARAWILEPDVAYAGAWLDLFEKYDKMYPDHDLIAVNATDVNGGVSWPHTNTCTLCKEGRWYRAFLPVFRISRTLARTVVDGLRGNTTGHHEAFIPTLCASTPGCRWASIKDKGVFRYRPVIKEEEARQRRIPGKLFHPLKSASAFRAVVE